MAGIDIEEMCSPDGIYRYRLTCKLSDAPAVCLFLMLNPATKNEAERHTYHTTRERCKKVARAQTCGTLVTCNLFAYRSPDPKALVDLNDPVGPDNDESLTEAAKSADMIVCAWGDGPPALRRKLTERVRKVVAILKSADAHGKLHALGKDLTRKGQPRHPRGRAPGLSECFRLCIRDGALAPQQ